MKVYWLCLPIVFLIAVSCISQTAKKQAPKAQSLFVCPDAASKQGCKSYQELVKARDKGLPSNDYYVCFRKDLDEFFVVSFTKPPLKVDGPTTLVPGVGYASSYKNGVDDSTTEPNLEFSGNWNQYGFVANLINFEAKDEKDNVTGVVISESQFSATFKYASTKGETLVYGLTIQRSTGRFAESVRKDSEQMAFADNTGRCIYRK
jgi:hypothetical protein